MLGFGWIKEIRRRGAEQRAQRDTRADARTDAEWNTDNSSYARRAESLYEEACLITRTAGKKLLDGDLERLTALSGEMIYAARRIEKLGGSNVQNGNLLLSALGEIESLLHWSTEHNIQVCDERDRAWVESTLSKTLGNPDPTIYMFTTGLRKGLEIASLRLFMRRAESLIESSETPPGKDSVRRAVIEKNIQYILQALPSVHALQMGTREERLRLGYALGRVLQRANGKAMEIWLPEGFDRGLIPRTDPDT